MAQFGQERASRKVGFAAVYFFVRLMEPTFSARGHGGTDDSYQLLE